MLSSYHRSYLISPSLIGRQGREHADALLAEQIRVAISDNGGGVQTAQAAIAAAAAFRRGSAPYAIGGAALHQVTSPTALHGCYYPATSVLLQSQSQAPPPPLPLVNSACAPALGVVQAADFGAAAAVHAGVGASVALVSLPSYPTGSTTGSGLPASPSHSAVTSPRVMPNTHVSPLSALMLSSTPYAAGSASAAAAIPTNFACTVPAAYYYGGGGSSAGLASAGAINLSALASTVYRLQEEHNAMFERLLALSREYQTLARDSISEREAALLELQQQHRRLHPIAEALERDGEQLAEQTGAQATATSSLHVSTSSATVTPQPLLGASASAYTLDSDPNVDQQLVRWLRELRIDAATIELVARRENFDLHTLLHCVQSREELTAALITAPAGQRATGGRRVPSGSLWRIWNAISCHRRRQHSSAASSGQNSSSSVSTAEESRAPTACSGASEPRCPCALCSS